VLKFHAAISAACEVAAELSRTMERMNFCFMVLGGSGWWRQITQINSNHKSIWVTVPPVCC
jgi:hypothetical protein